MSRFEYSTPCPECSKLSQNARLGFDTDSGKFTCDGETVPKFEQMPGESAPAESAEKVVSTSEFGGKPSVTEPEMTEDQIAALDTAMSINPRPRDFGSQVVEPQDEVTAGEPPVTHGEAIPDTIPAIALEPREMVQ